MVQFQGYGAHSSVRPTTDAITRFVESALVTRGACTKAQFDTVRGLMIDQVRQRFELSAKGAEQAIDPILRRLIHVEAEPKNGVRRAVTER
jgi:hypothetical protein